MYFFCLFLISHTKHGQSGQIHSHLSELTKQWVVEPAMVDRWHHMVPVHLNHLVPGGNRKTWRQKKYKWQRSNFNYSLGQWAAQWGFNTLDHSLAQGQVILCFFIAYIWNSPTSKESLLWFSSTVAHQVAIVRSFQLQILILIDQGDNPWRHLWSATWTNTKTLIKK